MSIDKEAEPVRRSSPTVRTLHESIKAIESVANRLLAKKDAEISRLETINARYRKALEIVAGCEQNKLIAMQAKCALDNIGPSSDSAIAVNT